ncbi:hypothetical protein M9H77_19423 [Catharanthus roseus]|uniref:Uncharacterized protein n=1 Tax=Catharanthus roseus TaxID=4058 RepID=A0ACC0BA96_CATRO|nr:hypothetical protein M9H77_19423 [Catharanthus roseus]
MADDERALEELLELQLQEQRESLGALNDALNDDPSNPELLAVQAELVQAIRDAEEGLLHLKQARLLQEVDIVLQQPKVLVEDAKVETLDSIDVQSEPLADQSYSVGSKCRFRHTDGRWYNGVVVGLEGHFAKLSFLTPTTESMLMCKFFLQQRCRFGSNCRLSHGIDVPLSSLKKYVPSIWEPSLVGSSIWAVSNLKAGIWRKAELESWDETLRLAHVVYQDDGSSAKLGAESISLSEFANMSTEDETDTSSEEYDSSSDEEDNSQGLGFLESTTMQRGIQTETTIFAKWENHTRGVASKMMANMGYREGMGLGASGQGMVDPISVKVLPAKQSLDHAVEAQDNKEDNEKRIKKRSRGGKRKREKKFAAAARAAKEEEELRPDVFSLINKQLAIHAETVNGGGSTKKQNKANRKEEDRKTLVAYDHEIKELKIHVERLEEMVNRNKKEKAIYDAALRKLNETRKALAEAEAARAAASNAVFSKEKEKRWLKF